MTNKTESLEEQLTDLLTQMNGYRRTEPDDLLVQFVVERERLVAEKIIAYLDERHYSATPFSQVHQNVDIDRLYKGLKNDIRSLYESDYGYDPTPNYPIKHRFGELQQQSSSQEVNE